MVLKYGDRGRCWSNYLKLCLDNGTAIPDPSLKLTKEEWEWVLEPLQARVDKMVSEADKPPLMGVGIVTKLEGNFNQLIICLWNINACIYPLESD